MFRSGRRAARRTARRVVRRRPFFAAPLIHRRPVIRRPLGAMLIMGAAAGVAYKLGREEAQRIQEYTGVSPDQLSEEDLKEAMQDLDIQSQPLVPQDHADLQSAQAGGRTPASPTPSAPTHAPPAPSGQADYIAELERLAGLRDMGVITPEEFQAKKKQLLEL